MNQPTLASDYWCLVSGEERHNTSPSTFELPSLADRKSLKPGQGAKLIFMIEGEEEDGTVSTSTERMWVIVTSREADGYMGILDNQPASLPPETGFYLCQGAEVPFLPEHVIAIEDPPAQYSAEKLATPPTKRWRHREV
ncbi:hypothetical protein PQU95_05480 [Vogesella sp. DC21W]|uniref:DUF2314 domain-containing protein n=1 Tax=Vogesella aquatica TaxID=2984206 RepID=A0ABT5IVV2_9NEIS|nr:hypothetical protein [Vogesella aquatica]MDC7716664.1 hypothetical protein [Vogesella aquatica]